MEDAFQFVDELGPAKVLYITLPHVGLKAVVAVDNTACGPAIGGVRMAPDVSAHRASEGNNATHFPARSTSNVT